MIDRQLGGGLRACELTLLGSAQGLGETPFALQVARALTVAGDSALYVCFDHREQDVPVWLLAMELGLRGGLEGTTSSQLRSFLAGGSSRLDGLPERLAGDEGGGAALRWMVAYAPRLHLDTMGCERTAVADLRVLVEAAAPARPLVVVVDYLRKLSVDKDPADEAERVTEVAEKPKDLALLVDVPVFALATADKPGLDGRTRLQHLQGSTALAYDADVALLMKNTRAIVARHHLVIGTANAVQYRPWVVCTADKNHGGRNGVDLEFREQFAHGHFDVLGQVLAEQLVYDRVHVA